MVPPLSKDIPTMTRGLLSLEHAAQWSDVSVKTVKRWISQGLPFFQSGPRSMILIDPHDIRTFLTRRVAPKPTLDRLVDQVMGELRGGKG